MEKFLIIDGSALVFQSFFGMPNKIKNKYGKNVEGVICFLGILLKTIKQINPNELLILFDGENKLERKSIDSDYKANRPDFSLVEDEDNPFVQLEIVKKVLESLNFSYVETNNCEADDYIASLCKKHRKEKEIIVSSPDKDFFQLVDDNISVFTYRGKKSVHWTKQLIIDTYGFEPKYFTLLKALTGDMSDNIKGVKGIGLKTASLLIQSFGDINSLYNNLDKVNERIRKLLQDTKEKVYQNYQIIDLKNNCTPTEDMDYTFLLPTKSSTEILRELDVL